MTYRGAYIRSHTHVGDCIADFIREVYPDLPDDDREPAWIALGMLVDLAIRRPLQNPTEEARPATPEPRTVAVPPTVPIQSADGSYLCPDCGFDSLTATASKRHFRRMHGDLMHPDRVAAEKGHQLTAKEAWERSHGVNLPFPGDDAASA